MKVWEAAIQILAETKNDAVMWGDTVLLHLIAERANMKSKNQAWKTEQAVLNALTRNPGPLIPWFTRLMNGRMVRIFRYQAKGTSGL